MSGVNFDRFSGVRIHDAQEMPYLCDTCGEELHNSFTDDICDSCAVKQGWLSREEEV